MSYNSAIKKVMSLTDFERSVKDPNNRVFKLDRMFFLLEELGNPQAKIPAIHIAGTKGKGSTASMIESILSHSGYVTGLFTSPHLHKFTERIRIMNQPISDTEFEALVDKVWGTLKLVESNHSLGSITTFEMLTAMAFLHFNEIQADFQIVEVGMGGRLDATNVINPTASVITRISLDHTETLGNTISAIAGEKAGIIKPNIPVIFAPQTSEAEKVFTSKATSLNCPLTNVKEKFWWEITKLDSHKQKIKITGELSNYSIETNLLGDHQADNAATSIATIEALIKMGVSIKPKSIIKGFENINLKGRFQVIESNRIKFVLDGAHNPDSIQRLISSFKKYFNPKKVILVFGCIHGHDYKKMINNLSELKPIIVVSKSRHPKSVEPSDISKEFGCNDFYLDSLQPTISYAIDKALTLATNEDIILITGSFSVVGEALEKLERIEPEIY